MHSRMSCAALTAQRKNTPAKDADNNYVLQELFWVSTVSVWGLLDPKYRHKWKSWKCQYFVGSVTQIRCLPMELSKMLIFPWGGDKNDDSHGWISRNCWYSNGIVTEMKTHMDELLGYVNMSLDISQKWRLAWMTLWRVWICQWKYDQNEADHGAGDAKQATWLQICDKNEVPHQWNSQTC